MTQEGNKIYYINAKAGIKQTNPPTDNSLYKLVINKKKNIYWKYIGKISNVTLVNKDDSWFHRDINIYKPNQQNIYFHYLEIAKLK